ncbi:DUF4349 domain-containing protein [Jatrophihabitans sp. YIM 134969]
MRTRITVTLAVVAAAVVTFFLVAGAAGVFRGSPGGADSEDGASAAGVAAPAAASAAPGAGSVAAGNDSGTDLGQAGTVAARDVVRTAQVRVTADDPIAAATRAEAITRAAGGRVEQDTRDTSAHLVLRVPADRLDATLAQVAGLGRQTSSEVQGDDVTAQTADLGARVEALQTSVDRLRTLLTTSGNLGDLLSVETQLTQRQAELESLQAQQRTLTDQVALATVTLDLVPPAVAAARSEPTGFGGAVAGGWHGFTVVVQYLLAALGYALPFLLLGAVVVTAVVVVRRRRRSPPTPSDPTPSTS